MLPSPTASPSASFNPEAARWSAAQARDWYDRQPWLVGCNFLPSNAINQLEMFQPETFDPATIQRELSWAAGLGMNVVRVYLHDLLWSIDPMGFLDRLDRFLGIASGLGIRGLLVFFDDCHFSQPQLGPQPAPQPGIHNSGWKQSPGEETVLAFDNGTVTEQERVRLQGYVQGVIGHFRDDARVLMWDIYNEPGQRDLLMHSLNLFQAAWSWAKAVRPTQPLTSGLEMDWDKQREELTRLHQACSDVVTFHSYGGQEDGKKLRAFIASQQSQPEPRPLICTEYMAREHGSTFQTYMPIFKQHRVGCLNWGLVAGKSNTIWPWTSRRSRRGPVEILTPDMVKSPDAKPARWFHDIFHVDGTPYDPAEAAFIREMTEAATTVEPLR